MSPCSRATSSRSEILCRPADFNSSSSFRSRTYASSVSRALGSWPSLRFGRSGGRNLSSSIRLNLSMPHGAGSLIDDEGGRFDDVTDPVLLSHLSAMATSAPPRTPSGTRVRILDAAFDRVMDIGLARTTVEDVARAAGLSRQTIYRYFPSKGHSITALVLREEERFLDGIREAFARDPNLEAAISDGILFCLRFAREHPLLDRLLETDPETLLPYLTTRGAPVIRRARQVLKGLLVKKAWVRADLLD